MKKRITLTGLFSLYVSEFFCRVETRARFVGKVAVSVYLRARIEFLQVYQQAQQRGLLRQRAGVLRILICRIHAADVAHADGV